MFFAKRQICDTTRNTKSVGFEIMKHCPNCRSSYADDTLKFCLQDGALLVGDTNKSTELPTIAFGDTSGNEEVTEQFRTNEPTKRFTTNKDAGQMRIDVPEARPNNWEQSRETQIASVQPKPQKSNTLIAVLATVLVMLILFGVAGIGAWLYFSKDQTDVAKNTNTESNSGDEKIISNDNSNKESSTPTPTKKDSTPIKTETPSPKFNPEEVKKTVSERIYSWKSLAESRNLSAYMESYADKLDYYNRKGASAAFVRSDKQKAFTQYDSIKITLSNMTVTPDSSGETATAVFDKAWVFQNYEKTSQGKVQTQLKLQNFGGSWKITSERDLKVYFVK